MDNQSKKLKAIAVVHPNGVITAFFNQLPGLVVQGSSHDDVNTKLNLLMGAFIKKLQSSVGNFEIETKAV